MARSADAQDGTAAQLHEPGLGRRRAPEGEHELDRPLLQQVLHCVEGDEPQHRQHLRPVGAQLLQSGAEEPQLGGVPAADDHALGRLPAGLLHPGQGDVGQLHDLTGVLEEEIALLGQPDALAGAVEELYPQLVLQSVDLVADGGLGDVEALGRPGKVQKVGDLQKALQLCGIHQDLPAAAPPFV